MPHHKKPDPESARKLALIQQLFLQKNLRLGPQDFACIYAILDDIERNHSGEEPELIAREDLGLGFRESPLRYGRAAACSGHHKKQLGGQAMASPLHETVDCSSANDTLSALHFEASQIRDITQARRADIITQAFSDYPELDHNSPDYNKDLVAKINRMDLAYRAEGKPADEAMRLAIIDFMPKGAATT